MLLMVGGVEAAAIASPLSASGTWVRSLEGLTSGERAR